MHPFFVKGCIRFMKRVSRNHTAHGVLVVEIFEDLSVGFAACSSITLVWHIRHGCSVQPFCFAQLQHAEPQSQESP